MKKKQTKKVAVKNAARKTSVLKKKRIPARKKEKTPKKKSKNACRSQKKKI